jgi:hypothetical protein
VRIINYSLADTCITLARRCRRESAVRANDAAATRLGYGFHQPARVLFSEGLLTLYNLFICSAIPSDRAHSVQGQKLIVNRSLLVRPVGIALGSKSLGTRSLPNVTSHSFLIYLYLVEQREYCEVMSDRERHQQLPLTNLQRALRPPARRLHQRGLLIMTAV